MPVPPDPVESEASRDDAIRATTRRFACVDGLPFVTGDGLHVGGELRVHKP